jgi:ATP-binding cassette subfamily B multidrug efflux pump
MLRLTKYLKPYLLLILIAVVLLFVQAFADLALPDYMSNIVDYGIQQGGVVNAVPMAIRQSEMNRLVTFMTADNKNAVLADYTLVSQNSPEYANDVKLYPDLAKEPIYVLKSVNQTEITKLNPIMGKALLVVSGIEQTLANPAAAQAMGKSFGFDLSKIPPGTDVFALMAKLPAATLTQITATIDQKFATLGTSMIVQMSVGAVKTEYAALGMNTNQTQTNYIIHTGMLMLLVTLVSVLCTIAVGFLSARTAAGLARDLRRNVFQKVESFASTEFDKFSTASLITRSTNDVTQIQMVVIMMMRMVIYAPIIGVGGIIRALAKSTSMWWIIALAVVVLLGLVMTVFSIALPKFKIIQNLIDRLNLVTRENLSGMMVIRAFNMQKFEEKRFDKANQDLTSVSACSCQPRNGCDDAGNDVDHERRDRPHHLGGCPPGGEFTDASGRYDRLHAICHANRVCLPDAFDDVHHPAEARPYRLTVLRMCWKRNPLSRIRKLPSISRLPSKARSSSAM